jgi:hypothetical protein
LHCAPNDQATALNLQRLQNLIEQHPMPEQLRVLLRMAHANNFRGDASHSLRATTDTETVLLLQLINQIGIVGLCSTSNNFLRQLITRPSALANAYLPSMPDSVLALITPDGNNVTKFVRHTCNYIYGSKYHVTKEINLL